MEFSNGSEVESNPCGCSEYCLNLDTGIVRTTYRQGNAKFTREIFVSAVDDLIFVRLDCDKPGQIRFDATLIREQDATTKANLQGIWNEHMNAPWNSDFHTNINLQMNYWPAEVCNLTECHLPLFDYMDTLVEPGSRTAKIHYGAGGWVVHHLSDVWGFTTPADGIHGIWPMGAAWLCEHVWEHYQFSGDKEFLAKRAYPLMKGAAQFICCQHCQRRGKMVMSKVYVLLVVALKWILLGEMAN